MRADRRHIDDQGISAIQRGHCSISRNVYLLAESYASNDIGSKIVLVSP